MGVAGDVGVITGVDFGWPVAGGNVGGLVTTVAAVLAGAAVFLGVAGALEVEGPGRIGLIQRDAAGGSGLGLSVASDPGPDAVAELAGAQDEAEPKATRAGWKAVGSEDAPPSSYRGSSGVL